MGGAAWFGVRPRRPAADLHWGLRNGGKGNSKLKTQNSKGEMQDAEGGVIGPRRRRRRACVGERIQLSIWAVRHTPDHQVGSLFQIDEVEGVIAGVEGMSQFQDIVVEIRGHTIYCGIRKA